jgi:hypothetical protein
VVTNPANQEHSGDREAPDGQADSGGQHNADAEAFRPSEGDHGQHTRHPLRWAFSDKNARIAAVAGAVIAAVGFALQVWTWRR